MLSSESLRKIAGGLRARVTVLQKANDSLNAKIAQFEADTSRSQSYVTENIKGAREAILTGARTELAAMHEAAEVAEAQVEFWASASLLLSRIPFNSDPMVDALQRTRYAVELPSMGAPLLSLIQKNALADGNLALVWACAVAGGDLDLSAVEVPGQQEALDLIVACDEALAEAELLVAAMSGQSVDPVRKLEIGRRMQSNRPTSHNSPGRPAIASH